jgi:hypothetical protein
MDTTKTLLTDMHRARDVRERCAQSDQTVREAALSLRKRMIAVYLAKPQPLADEDAAELAALCAPIETPAGLVPGVAIGSDALRPRARSQASSDFSRVSVQRRLDELAGRTDEASARETMWLRSKLAKLSAEE